MLNQEQVEKLQSIPVERKDVCKELLKYFIRTNKFGYTAYVRDHYTVGFNLFAFLQDYLTEINLLKRNADNKSVLLITAEDFEQVFGESVKLNRKVLKENKQKINKKKK